ncbi:LytTR family transcriptional regulator DNA-binding domain-containing protein [Aequorivita flava]|uniref:LytTR family transcriptional regulator DNA-binding domain-containing protein n=1 Tax=Aequorivita flava TaxID=3114371 RepID=A0AB35YSG7_9FLAO
MRHYLIIGKTAEIFRAVIPEFDESGEFKCLGITAERDIDWVEIANRSPELVLIDLDTPDLEVLKIVEKCNRLVGVIPNYIGITASYKRGFKAFRAGFLDVIFAPFIKENILLILNKYKYIYKPNYLFCIDTYRDFIYLNLHEVLFVKADNYTAEFVKRDGSIIHYFKNLKHTHALLPFNFQRINRSYVINCFYVSRIHTGKSRLYLRHYDQCLHYTNKYRDNILVIKKLLLKAPLTVFT